VTKPTNSVRVFGIIPAAGQSRRMGRPKQLLHIAGQPMLLHVAGVVLDGGVEGLVVVTQTALVGELGLDRSDDLLVAVNDDPDSAMIDSVVLGINRLASVHGVRSPDGILVLPADCPGVDGAAVRACAEAYRRAPGRIIVAAYRGRRGHPMVFPFGLVPEVRGLARTGGLDQLLAVHPDLVVESAGDSEGVVGDMDTAEDYSRFRREP
jgi:molybdenum cofactor cytidylyltransferase